MNKLDDFLDQFKDLSMFTGYMIYVCWQKFDVADKVDIWSTKHESG